MTKPEFLAVCSSHNTYKIPGSLGSVLRLVLCRERHGHDYILELRGSWGGSPERGTCLVANREVYRPNNQMFSNWPETKERIRKESVKYIRWLKEWSETRNPSGVVVDLELGMG